MKRLLVLLLALIPTARGLAGDQLIWTTTDFPPAHILSGDQAGKGILDVEARYIAERLGEFTHVTREVSNSGAWGVLKAQDGVCISGAVDLPERHKYAVYSRVANVTLTAELLIRADQAARFAAVRTDAGDVDLGWLAAAASLHGARVFDRPLGPAIEQFTSGAGQKEISGLPNSTKAIAMLDQGRVDYALGYPYEMGFYRATHPGAAEMIAIPISGEPRVLYLHIACSNGPIGRRAIARIDEILRKAGTPPPWFTATGHWYGTEEFGVLSSLAVWPK